MTKITRLIILYQRPRDSPTCGQTDRINVSWHQPSCVNKKEKKNIQKKRCRQVDICGTWLTTGTVLKLEKWVRQKRGWRQNKDINTVGVACAKDLLADLVQRLFSNSVQVRQFELVLLLLVTLKSDLLLLFILCQYCFWHYYKYNLLISTGGMNPFHSA